MQAPRLLARLSPAAERSYRWFAARRIPLTRGYLAVATAVAVLGLLVGGSVTLTAFILAGVVASAEFAEADTDVLFLEPTRLALLSATTPVWYAAVTSPALSEGLGWGLSPLPAYGIALLAVSPIGAWLAVREVIHRKRRMNRLLREQVAWTGPRADFDDYPGWWERAGGQNAAYDAYKAEDARLQQECYDTWAAIPLPTVRKMAMLAAGISADRALSPDVAALSTADIRALGGLRKLTP